MNEFEELDYSKRFDFGLWKRLLHYAKPYRKTLFSLALVMVAVASIDASFPILTRYAIDTFVVPGNAEGLPLFLAGYLTLVGLLAFHVWLLILFAGKIEMGLTYDLRRNGFEHLQNLSFSYYDKTPVGWIMARMTSDSQRLGETISWGLVDMVWGASMMVAIAVAMMSMNPRLALVVLAVVPLLAVVSLIFQKRILSAQREVRKTNSRISGAFNEGIMGAKTTKVLVREAENLREFSELTGLMHRSSVRAARFSALFLPCVLTLASVATSATIWIGGSGVITGVLSFGTLVAFLSYTVQFFEPVRELARVMSELQSAQASAERIMSLLETPPEVVDSLPVIERYGDVVNPRRENWPPMQGNVEFRNVTFRYTGGEQVLTDFNLSVAAGETVALVGETGSGKTTIVNLACRFYEPTSGEILIDGTDYRERSLLYHYSHLGYVLQAPYLFNGSVRDNIRYGRLDATDAMVEEAAKVVNAHEFIEKLEHGYQTEVGEGGGLLSTGEKQLISFARAVLANPRIFVLDEATSSVDTETELRIQRAIQSVLHDRTSFIVAHRLSTIKAADRILVLERGTIIEEGTHHQLLLQRSHYYRLYTNQFLEEKETELLNA